jgi:AI-2 transport protein TqsA
MSATATNESLRSIGIGIIAIGVAITGLIIGSSFLIPLAIAILLWNLLEAVISAFTRIGIGRFRLTRSISTLLGIAVVACGLYTVASILLGQADALSAAWPRYVILLETRISELAQWLGAERSQKVQQLMAEFDLTKRIPGLLFSAQSFIVSLFLIVAYVGFLLAEGQYLGAKVAAMSTNDAQRQKASDLLNSVSGSIRRYIWIKTVVSLITAGASYIVLRWIGIDFAETWAILIFVLNFIPNIGSIMAVVFPTIIAILQFDTFTPFFVVVVSLTVLQVAIGSILEPILMGKTLNMSPFAIILGLAFWGTIWGIVGMFLSVPILVVVMIVCANVPSWRWIAILLSKDGQITV